MTAAYDAAIARWFAEAQFFPEQLTLTFRKLADLAYGENPHQTAAYYEEVGSREAPALARQPARRRASSRTTTSPTSRRHGAIAREFAEPVAVIVKHANPCGVAVAETIEEAYELRARRRPRVGLRLRDGRQPPGRCGARRTDRRAVRRGDARSRDTTRTRSSCCSASRRCASCAPGSGGPTHPGERDYRRVLGGLLVQQRDAEIDEREGMEVVVGAIDEARWDELLFAWRVCKHASSNAIVLAKGRQTIGIGAGQTSRVDAVQIALEKARRFGHDSTGAVLASDAFFPFADGPTLALEAGVGALIQPGGSQSRRGDARRRRRGGRGDGLHRPPTLPSLRGHRDGRRPVASLAPWRASTRACSTSSGRRRSCASTASRMTSRARCSQSSSTSTRAARSRTASGSR